MYTPIYIAQAHRRFLHRHCHRNHWQHQLFPPPTQKNRNLRGGVSTIFKQPKTNNIPYRKKTRKLKKNKWSQVKRESKIIPLKIYINPSSIYKKPCFFIKYSKTLKKEQKQSCFNLSSFRFYKNKNKKNLPEILNKILKPSSTSRFVYILFGCVRAFALEK